MNSDGVMCPHYMPRGDDMARWHGFLQAIFKTTLLLFERQRHM